MPLKELQIYGFRGFAEPATITFAKPNGTVGSGLTALVGPNNGGKSSILEVLQFLQRFEEVPTLTDARRNGKTGGRLSITYKFDEGQARLASPDSGGDVRWRERQLELRAGQVCVLPSRRYMDGTFQPGSGMNRDVYLRNSAGLQSRQPYRPSLGSRLVSIQENRDSFDRILGDVIGEVPNWYIERTDQSQSYIRYCTASSPHSSDGLGDGFITLFFIADALHDSQEGDTIVIDEPELSLHPAYQRRLAAVLARYASHRQIIYATHSPYFVDWQYVIAGAHVERVYQKEHSSCVSGLTADTVAAVHKLTDDRSNPHVLGLDAREVFFLSDGIILVEGQEDVLNYPEVARQVQLSLAGQFYGWGVGGASKMPVVASVLRDLGFERVVGLLDAGQEALLPKMVNAFPRYAFGCISAADIRTKNAYERKAVRGLLDENGVIRADCYTPTATLLMQVNDYLGNGAVWPGGCLQSQLISNARGVHGQGVVIPPDAKLGAPLHADLTGT